MSDEICDSARVTTGIVEIEFCERMADRTWDGKPKYHAQVKGRPGLWAAGESVDEAVGDLVRCHPECFGVTITDVGRKFR